MDSFLKQWISSSLKHDTVPIVNNLYVFMSRTPQNRLHYGIVQVVNGAHSFVAENWACWPITGPMNVAFIFVTTQEKTALSSQQLYVCKLNAEASCV